MGRLTKVVVLACVLGIGWPVASGGDFAALFNGKDLTGWKARPNGWSVDEEGAMAWKKGCGYIWTEKSFGDFVLDLEFKVSKGCNSGIFIRSDPRNAVQGGIEIQVLDSFGKQRVGRHDCCAVYDALAPSKNAMKKAGEWNRAVITCNDNKIEIVLNGEKIIDMDLDKWDEPRKNPDGSKNKYAKPLKDFAREGHIGFQDHGRAVWYRNVKIKELTKEQ